MDDVMLQAVPGLQEGIYYSHRDYPRNSFALVFLRFRQPQPEAKVRKTLSGLWQMYSKLKKGLISGLHVNEKEPGTLSVLFGYGPKFFEVSSNLRIKPASLNDEWLFLPPGLGGTPILPDVRLRYENDITANEAANDHVLIQFIGDTQLATHRAVVETWRFLRNVETEGTYAAMYIRTFFAGFNRPDGRSWLGFHDGLSNIKSADRLKAIQVNKKDLVPDDHWTANGTYLAFLRISIDLDLWDSISEKDQERIVGRNKQTGCPLVRLDNSKNVYQDGCPAEGTLQVTEKRNDQFREYPFKSVQMRVQASTGSVPKGHVQNMQAAPYQIFRQGFEFLEPTDNPPYFRAGLNFVSFQGGTDKIYQAIKYGFGKVNFGGPGIPGADRLLHVRAAGIFLVPPFKRSQNFPGETIFEQKLTDPLQSRGIPSDYM